MNLFSMPTSRSGLLCIFLSTLFGVLTPQTAQATVSEEDRNVRVESSLPGHDFSNDKASIFPQSKELPGIVLHKAPLEKQLPPGELLKVSRLTAYIQQYNHSLDRYKLGHIANAIVHYSSHYKIDYRLLASLIATESSFRESAVSSSGAIGMGQLKPSTAEWLGVHNPYDPVDNIAGTARFLSWLVSRYSGRLEYALSAYYQGPGHVDRNGITPVCVPYLQKINHALGPLM